MTSAALRVRPAWATYQGQEWPVRVIGGRALSPVPLSRTAERIQEAWCKANFREVEGFSYPVEDLPPLRFVEDAEEELLFWSALCVLQTEQQAA